MAAAGSLLAHPADIRLFWCHRMYRNVIDKLSSELVDALRKKGASPS
jgi:hypothetical protein